MATRVAGAARSLRTPIRQTVVTSQTRMLSSGSNGSHRPNVQSHPISYSLAASPSGRAPIFSCRDFKPPRGRSFRPSFRPLVCTTHRFRTQAFQANPRQTRPGLIPRLRLRLQQPASAWLASRKKRGQTQPVIEGIPRQHRNDATHPFDHS
ncbi:hypothetical protein LY78DRAFT_484403 [Colletotrichum sublineola]|nr:hypothetical protein LY78DRAFT_484403 [Colletotrichum sublineola]